MVTDCKYMSPNDFGSLLNKILKNTKLFWGLMIIQIMEMVDDKREIQT